MCERQPLVPQQRVGYHRGRGPARYDGLLRALHACAAVPRLHDARAPGLWLAVPITPFWYPSLLAKRPGTRVPVLPYVALIRR